MGGSRRSAGFSITLGIEQHTKLMCRVADKLELSLDLLRRRRHPQRFVRAEGGIHRVRHLGEVLLT